MHTRVDFDKFVGSNSRAAWSSRMSGHQVIIGAVVSAYRCEMRCAIRARSSINSK